MDSRMKKYEYQEEQSMSRVNKNSNIYSSLDMNELSRIKTNNNVSVISEAPKQIDIEKIKRYINGMNEQAENSKRIKLDEIPEEEEIIVERKEPKDYDINSVLERARGNRTIDYESERHKKINNTEYDILKKIKIEKKVKEDDLTDPINDLNTEERTIVDLLSNISKTSSIKKEELFSDLMSDNENTVVMGPITDEVNTANIAKDLESITNELETSKKPLDDLTQDLLLENEKLKALIKKENESSLNDEDEQENEENKEQEEQSEDDAPAIEKIDPDKMSSIDKSFFTNSLTFSKNDFESFEDMQDEIKSSSFYTKFAIVMIILVLIATAVVVANYILDLNWF